MGALVGHVALIVLIVIGIILFILAALIFLGDFMDKTNWTYPRPELDWWSVVCGVVALIGFAGLAYVIWAQ